MAIGEESARELARDVERVDPAAGAGDRLRHSRGRGLGLAFALSAAITGCEGVDVDALVFTCRSDRDCARSFLCDPVEHICKRPEHITHPDAGPSDSGTPDSGDDPPDAGPIDSGPNESARCHETTNAHSGEPTAWWCYNALPDELDAFALAHNARIIDIDVERAGERRFAAVLIPYDGLMRSWTFHFLRNSAGVYPELANGGALKDLEAYELAGDVALAAIIPSNAYRCGFFWWHTFPDPASVYAGRALNNVRSPVIDLEEYRNATNDKRVVFIAYGSGSSTVSFDLDADTITSRLADPANGLVSFEATENYGRFNVSILSKSPATPPVTWVHGLTERQLLDELELRGAQIEDLEVYLGPGGRRFAARLIPSSTIAVARREESQRLSRALRSATTNATVGIYLKEVRGEAHLFHNEDHPFLAGEVLHAFLGMHAVNEAEDRDDLALSTPIPIPPAGCSTATTATITATLQNTLMQMYSMRDPRSANAIVAYFGRETLASKTFSWSMKNTDFALTPGCDTPALASTTTLLDQAVLYEYAIHCAVRFESTLRRWMPGRTGDPQRMRQRIEDVLIVEGIRLRIPEPEQGRFLTRAEVEYTFADLPPAPGEGARVRRSIVGRVAIPYCTGDAFQWTRRSYLFGLFVDGEGDPAAVNLAFQAVEREMLRPLVRLAFASGTVCFTR